MFDDLRELHDLAFRAYVRHVMLFATFPYHVAQEMSRNGALHIASERRHRREDHRWLR